MDCGRDRSGQSPGMPIESLGVVQPEAQHGGAAHGLTRRARRSHALRRRSRQGEFGLVVRALHFPRRHRKRYEAHSRKATGPRASRRRRREQAVHQRRSSRASQRQRRKARPRARRASRRVQSRPHHRRGIARARRARHQRLRIRQGQVRRALERPARLLLARPERRPVTARQSGTSRYEPVRRRRRRDAPAGDGGRHGVNRARAL